MSDLPDQHKQALATRAGPGGVIGKTALAALLQEQRGRDLSGHTPLALAPNSPEALSKIMAYCYQHDLAMVPQGGNSGLVGGQIPHGEILISLRRMRAVRAASVENFTLTIEAGATLWEAQQEAEKINLLFPISIGSEGSCQIGGNIATNAGGVNVLHYGNMREQVLGLEVILPDGTIWNGLNRLRKNNSGYDLKQIFIGAEGTLGIISAAVLRLYPRPKTKTTFYTSTASVEKALALMTMIRAVPCGALTSFELISDAAERLTVANIPAAQKPLSHQAPFYVLGEISGEDEALIQQFLEPALAQALKTKLIEDATIAQTERHRCRLWTLRHEISAAMRPEGAAFKGDIAVPVAAVPDFLRMTEKAVRQICPKARIIAFGHLGDGNIHYDIIRPEGTALDHLAPLRDQLEEAVLDCVETFQGSFAAEHGIGLFKRAQMLKRKDAVTMAMMRRLKKTFDPKGLMNPGRIF